mmetsp:Transcript_13712/g.29461  ORF Transcript_13712/g.29461 Transcript_13712/m.29461 type:complete len:237 (-) Transcript_13712:1725-2435(-)
MNASCSEAPPNAAAAAALPVAALLADPVACTEGTPGCCLRGTRLSFIKSANSSPFAMDHCVTRPSVEMDTSGSSRSGPRSNHRTFQTGSECLPVLTSLCMEGSPCLDLTSKIAMVPSYRPTAKMFGLCVAKSRAVTPELVSNDHSGYPGFLRLQNATRPLVGAVWSALLLNVWLPYPTARRSGLALFQAMHDTFASLVRGHCHSHNCSMRGTPSGPRSARSCSNSSGQWDSAMLGA